MKKHKKYVNHKSIVYAAILIVVATFSACGGGEKNNSDSSEIVMADDSELALLMRQFTKETDSIRAAVLRGESHPLWSRIRNIHTAIPTDSASSGPAFDGYASAFIAAVEKMEAADTLEVRYFNNVIDGCMNCHDDFCPGPMKRIRKFYVKE